MNAGTIVGYGVPLFAIFVVVFALVMERRERRKREDAKRLGLGGRAVRR